MKGTVYGCHILLLSEVYENNLAAYTGFEVLNLHVDEQSFHFKTF